LVEKTRGRLEGGAVDADGDDLQELVEVRVEAGLLNVDKAERVHGVGSSGLLCPSYE
jgi:hypothetical protein